MESRSPRWSFNSGVTLLLLALVLELNNHRVVSFFAHLFEEINQKKDKLTGKRKEVKCITAAVIIRYPSKLHRSTRSGPTAVCYAIGSLIRKSVCGVGISTPCREVSTRMISVFVTELSDL